MENANAYPLHTLAFTTRFSFNFEAKNHIAKLHAPCSSKTAKYVSINCKKHTSRVKLEYVNTCCSLTCNVPMTWLRYQKWLRAQSWFHRAPEPPFLPAFYCSRCFDLLISQVGFNIEHPNQVSRRNPPIVTDTNRDRMENCLKDFSGK